MARDGPVARPHADRVQLQAKESPLNVLAMPYNRAHHRFAVFTAGATFCLLIAGALVTSNDAGLSVPDWPTSFGSLYKIPHMVGGVRFEHTHRMIAEFVGLLTIILAVWTWRIEKRQWMKALAVGALATVIAQGVLGGLTVLFYLPPAISSAHAALAQTFFCIAVAIAVFTGRRWVEEVPEVELDSRRPSLSHAEPAVDFCALRAAHSGSDVSSPRNELVAARGKCAGGSAGAHLDSGTSAGRVRED